MSRKVGYTIAKSYCSTNFRLYVLSRTIFSECACVCFTTCVNSVYVLQQCYRRRHWEIPADRLVTFSGRKEKKYIHCVTVYYNFRLVFRGESLFSRNRDTRILYAHDAAYLHVILNTLTAEHQKEWLARPICYIIIRTCNNNNNRNNNNNIVMIIIIIIVIILFSRFE